MANNKEPNNMTWFSHDSDARHNTFLQFAMDEFGHFGYAAYFMILELMASAGTGDILHISDARLCSEMRSKRKVVDKYLVFCREQNELVFTYLSDGYHIQIKKFSKKQKNSKLKNFQTEGIDIVIDNSNRNKTSLVATPQKKAKKSEPKVEVQVPVTDVAVVASKPKELTPQQKLIRYFKEAKGVNANDTAWDRKHWNGRLGKEANAVLKAFDGDIKKAGEYILIKGEEWQHLPDWGLNGIVAAAGRDPRLVGGGDEENGHKNGALDAGSRDGSGRVGWTSPSGALAGDALRAIESAALRKQGPTDLGSVQPDIRGDED